MTAGDMLKVTEGSDMDGFVVQIVGKVIGLGIDHAFAESAATGKHRRELEAIDRQIQRTAEIAKAQGGAAPTVAISPATPPVARETIKIMSYNSPAPTCQLPEENGALDMPTTEETVTALKERLVKELYRFENDLQDGLRIADKPCDCAKSKHTGLITATAEELMSYETNPLYGNIVSWVKRHQPEFTPKEIAKHEPGYYQSLAPEIRNFRKQLEV